MPSAKRLRHQRAARRDLLELWRYTERVWRQSQADAYLTEIDRVVQDIAAGRTKGVNYNERYLKVRHKAHVIFYRETKREIVIVRVLHGHRDFDLHLPA